MIKIMHYVKVPNYLIIISNMILSDAHKWAIECIGC